MIRFEEALDIVAHEAKPLSFEWIGLSDCLGRILATDVFADMDMPPFDKSAVDGYACRREDLGSELQVKEVIAAGKEPQFEIGKDECAKLMTGGMVPKGADTVIMVEEVEVLELNRIRFTGSKTAPNICFRAEDIHKGDKVLEKGTLLRAQEVAILASVGKASPEVYEQVKIGIITTGDELVEPGVSPGPSQIRNSNAWQLIIQVKKAGCIPNYYGIAVDDEAETLSLIEKACAENQIVILTGGVSVGDFDFVPAVLARAGFDLKFRSIAVQPGKPSIFATRGSTYLFALPGNPVSSFVQFELLVRHLLNHMSGNFDSAKLRKLTMGFDYTRKRTDRKAFIPVAFLEDGSVGPIEYHGSAHIHSYIFAEGIISVEIGSNVINKGTLVDVRFL
ncbi:MAG: molybdopterin molybdotransferase MoeA [Bacteroidetes bacterium]|nr:molybdopterin molybdotransferase MoeA [Bacteroidota bacterium]